MKQRARYLWLTIGVIVLILIGDYICYRIVVNKMEQMQTDYEKRVSELVEVELTTQLEDTAAEVVKNAIDKESESVSASTGEETLTVDTVYQVQKYDVQKDTTVTEYETLPQDLVGKTKKEAEEYCDQYMKNLSADEYLEGLQSVGVTAFSSERLVVKKIYDVSKVAFRYYLIAVDGEVVVYYGDKKTVYEYTGIETKRLSTEERKMLKKGIEVEDEKTLYGILENYSS